MLRVWYWVLLSATDLGPWSWVGIKRVRRELNGILNWLLYTIYTEYTICPHLIYKSIPSPVRLRLLSLFLSHGQDNSWQVFNRLEKCLRYDLAMNLNSQLEGPSHSHLLFTFLKFSTINWPHQHQGSIFYNNLYLQAGVIANQRLNTFPGSYFFLISRRRR